MLSSSFLLPALIGLCAGAFGGLAGLGGGIVMIPLMTRFLGLDQHRAHGTSLVALVFTGIAGVIAYGRSGAVDAEAAALLAVTAIATAAAGARFAHALPAWKLKRSFGAFLLLAAFVLLLKPLLPVPERQVGGMMQIAILLLTGGFTGFLSGMMGVGGGSIMVPAMVLLAGFNQHMAQGSSLLAMIPAGATGAFTHWRLGNVRRDILPGLIPGILLGTLVGGSAAQFLPELVLRLVFAVILVWTGARYLRAQRPG